MRGKRKCLAETQEIVGLIGKSEESASEAADAACQADGLLAFFPNLQIKINAAQLDVLFHGGGGFWFQRLEEIELVETKDTHFPETVVIKIAFIDEQLAANHFVAGGDVAADVDAVNEVLFLFIE